MVKSLQRNIINDFRSMYMNGEIPDNMQGNEKRAYQLYLNIIQGMNEEQYKCLGCPVILRTYQLKDNSTIEYSFSDEQEECIDHVFECTHAVRELDATNMYHKFLNLINLMDE